MRALLLSLLLFVSGCAMTNEQLRWAYHGTNLADASTTVYGLNHGCKEGNPLLGEDPSDATIALFAVGSSVLYELVCNNAGEGERACRVAFLGVKALMVGANAYTISTSCN